jgi:acetone carboxylase gamma subunit
MCLSHRRMLVMVKTMSVILKGNRTLKWTTIQDSRSNITNIDNDNKYRSTVMSFSKCLQSICRQNVSIQSTQTKYLQTKCLHTICLRYTDWRLKCDISAGKMSADNVTAIYKLKPVTQHLESGGLNMIWRPPRQCVCDIRRNVDKMSADKMSAILKVFNATFKCLVD